MEEITTHLISVNSLIWLFLVVFMIHDFEEIIFVEPWIKKNFNQIINKVPERITIILSEYSTVTSSQFAVAVFVEFVLFTVITYLAAEQGSYIFFIGFNAILLIHVFTHFAQTLYLRMYTPGVITALLIILPYSIYLFYRLIGEGIVTLREVFIYAPFGLVLIPIVLFGHKLGKKIV
ncbi:HXXEE domain-containing protein [Ferviditalea candida]|uniref:HXXEE domain-containing protein n=1 Tax=Ferviditalea candida TaxID=3108399 RepID=A0ABU5ZFS4_9BACL|nr:HXXEE domain-containing protein [Paenibacillaceae bacterium T2]